MSSSESSYWCHSCQTRVLPITDEVICPTCQGGFVEKLEDNLDASVSSPESDDSPLTPNDFHFDMPLNILFPENTSSPNNTVFSWNFTNNRSGPSTSRSDSASSPGAPYNLRSRPQRSSSANETSARRNEHDLIQDNFMELHGNTGDYAWGPNGLDNIISQLLGQLENAGPPPASRDAIKNLPTISISQEDVDSGRDCSVCMDVFKLDENAKKLPCNHFFHIPCIDPWLELHNTCPICRMVVEDTPCGAPPPDPTGSSGPGSPGSSAAQNSQQESGSLFSLFSSLLPNRGSQNQP